jgi:ATP-binding cassette subfamily B multidrug efflux pump
MIFRWFENLIDVFDRPDQGAPPDRLVRFYAHYLHRGRWVLAAMFVVGFAVALVEVALFGFLGKLVDLAKSEQAAGFFDRHGPELLGMAAVAVVLRPLLMALGDLLMHQAVTPALTARIRWQQHRHVARQSLAFFQNDYAGRIANRIMLTGASLRESAVQIIDALWYVAVYAGSALFLFAQADWRLMLPLGCWLLAYVATLAFFVPRVRERSWRASQSKSRLMGRVVDGYTNIATLKLFPHARREDDYVAEAVRDNLHKVQRMTRLTTAMDVTLAVLNGLMIASTAGLGLWLWQRGAITLGAIALSTGLVIRIENMSGWIMWVVNGVFEGIGTVQDGMETVARAHAVTDAPGARPLEVSRGEVRFEDIHFHYGKRGGVIAGLDLVVRPGEKIGLVGPSGAGKSTLVNVLLRLYDLEAGRILIDGQDIARVTQDSLRGQIGVVTQDTSLLHRSILDNLRYGRPEASPGQIAAAVRQARADGFIDALVDGQGRAGLEAHVGERGVKLSGGQRQRIAIARVLLKDAPILVLDEATSALDSEVEAAIQDSLDTLMQGKTVIAIAHRLSTIARMDRLVVMEAGRIVETGSHAQLIAAGGLYARLWARQTGGFVAAEADA